MDRKQLEEIIGNIRFMDRRFRILEKGDGFLLQVQYMEACTDTGALEVQSARKWYISSHATETEVVDTAFAAVMRSMRHVVHEHFLYKGVRTMDPHLSIKARAYAVTHGARDARKPQD